MKASLLFMAFHGFPRTKMKQIIFDGTHGVTRTRPITNLIRYLEVEKCPPVHKICTVIGKLLKHCKHHVIEFGGIFVIIDVNVIIWVIEVSLVVHVG